MSEQVVEKDLMLQAESFWKKNQKNILIAITVIALAIGGWYAYSEFVVKPKEEKAAEALYKVQDFFAKDSSNIVINGDNATGVKGALYVIKTYGGTKSANLAHYYAGISYLKLKDFNNAIKYLKEFSTNAKQIQMAAYTALGHAYAEAGKKEDAVEYYKKAGNAFTEDENNTAENLFFAGALLETMNKNKEALELYKTIKEKYPNTDKGYQIDKFIYKLSIEKNDFSTN
jgi:tetratricopeptide (TPR) repeat protein